SMEVILPRDRLAGAINSMLAAHPYEEVAYDVYPLVGTDGPGPGRLAEPDRPVTVAELEERCRARLGPRVRSAGDLDRAAGNVALCAGAGAFLIPDAFRAGADVLITGDVKHHQALDTVAAGLTVIDAGHHGTEWPFVEALAEVLGNAVPGAQVTVAQAPTDPFAGS
ncbi:MAG: Nif3-like dinuclear metal center hexameric protein, partial [Actinomycetota bacterium]